jgi:hypothetical protein
MKQKKIKTIREIQRLQDWAIRDCNYNYRHYKRIGGYFETYDDAEVKTYVGNAKAAIYNELFHKEIFTQDFSMNLPDGSPVKMKNLTVDELINALEKESYHTRGTAALLLGKMKQCNMNIPEALLKVVKSEESLCVIVEAMRALKNMSGTNLPGTFFDFGDTQTWYDQNRARIQERLGCK